jgi:hypothetical protein
MKWLIAQSTTFDNISSRPEYGAAEVSSRQAYADAKAKFINRITQLAPSGGYPRDL